MIIPHPARGSYPVRDGNAVRPLIDGVPAFRRIGEAIETARHSLWLTVAFFGSDFRMPGSGHSLFDVLDRAVCRGLDVRVIFWRPNPESRHLGWTFAGSRADRDLLQARRSRFRARWDRAHGPYVQHQKSWVLDAGQPSEVAFVGGINLTAQAIGAPGHAEGGRHDVYVEVNGPAATDVHHNFVQRWNEASDRAAPDGCWAHDADDSLPFPTRLSHPRGGSRVQIQRNIRAGLYADKTASPGSVAYDIAAGERTVFDQYLLAIAAARAAIYIENQAIPIPAVADALEAALQRGVEVVVLVPAEPAQQVRTARRSPDRRQLFDRVARLGAYANFALAGIAARNAQGKRGGVYVHSKAMVIDDAWATIGSCNLHANSLLGHSEMNASIWDPAVARGLRVELLAEHLGEDTSHLDAQMALRRYRRIAVENRRRRDADDADWRGLAFRLDPETYGE
jgi:cardiolipin synthase A/B